MNDLSNVRFIEWFETVVKALMTSHNIEKWTRV